MPTDRTATEDFRDDPTGFLANAMILAPASNALIANHSEHLGLELLGQREPVTGTWTARMGLGGPLVPLYQVVKAPANEAYFRSYIADYNQGTTTFTTLGTNPNANFCFTANMNGCTFGIGSQANGAGALLVSHGNAANTGLHDNIPDNLQPATKKALQVAIQYTQAKAGHGLRAKVFEPEHYRAGGRMSVTFGHRQPGHLWHFYFIQYERFPGGAHVSYGCAPMVTNRIKA